MKIPSILRTPTLRIPAKLAVAATLTPALLLSAVLAGCGGQDDDAGLSRADVQEIVRAEMTASAAPTPQPGLTSAEVEEIVQAALDAVPTPQPGLTSAEVEEIVQAALDAAPTPRPGLTSAESREIARNAVASIPPRSAPAEYTRFFVENAISRYETDGLEATLAHYNREDSIDGQWYVFIIDENGTVIGHPDAQRLGLHLNGWVGSDANGYRFGPEILSATEEGKWVSYVYRNPESGGIGPGASGDFELKNVWVVRHDGMLFASGWYIEADEFTRMLVSTAVDKFRVGGLAATIAYFAQPDSALAGLEAAIAYYNSAEIVDGRWFAFIGDPDGNVVAHSNPLEIGKRVEALLGGAEPADGDGAWITSESLRVWVAERDGFLFGSGWRRDANGN